ncbi:MAG: hypothetical protein NT027_11485 [Proteobacteria bacterium]|nr:hypothetical protein [Pseudomonadota bacterium]
MKMKKKSFSLAMNFKVPTSLRFIAPILLGTALIGIILSTMRFGGKRESLGAYAEASLLRFAIRNSQYSSSTADKVVTISVRDSDMPTLRPAPHQTLRDAHIAEYAAILERVSIHNPRFVVISWLSSAHPLSVEYLRPLTDTIDRLGLASKVILAVHLYTTGAVPEELSRKYIIAEARDCYYDVNAFCTVNYEWTWMPQQIVKEFWPHPKPWMISENLPHTLPNFVLNLPDPKSLTNLSFLDFRPPVTAEIKNGSSIFIGNDVTQDLQFRDNKDLLQKTFISLSPDNRTLMSDGIPFHVFWATMAQMFLDDMAVAVVPAWLCDLALSFMCLAIIYAIYKLKGLALGPFLICAIGLPIANVFGIRTSNVYMPIIPIITAGFAMFIAAAFISVAVNSYRKWRLQAAEKTAESTTDIKENFISLISHNLNTPIAQLRGLLDTLIRDGGQGVETLQQPLMNLEFMRVAVRSVLDTSALSASPSAAEGVSLKKFWTQFEENEGIFLRRVGLTYIPTPAMEDEEQGEVWFYKFTLDSTVLRSCLQYAIFLNFVTTGSKKWVIQFEPIHFEPADPKGLKISIVSSKNESIEKIDTEIDLKFIKDAILRYQDMLSSSRSYLFTNSENLFTIVVPEISASPSL